MDPLYPDDEDDPELQQFIEDQLGDLRSQTPPYVAVSNEPIFINNEDNTRLAQVTQLLQDFDEFETTMLPPYEMDPMNTQTLSDRYFVEENQDNIDMIIQERTQEEWQFIMEGTGDSTENVNLTSYVDHASGSGSGCNRRGSGVVSPLMKYANVTSYGGGGGGGGGGGDGGGGVVNSFMKDGYYVQIGNGMNIWRWMGGSARAKAKPPPRRRKRKYRGVYQTEVEAAVRHEHQKIKNRAAAAVSFEKRQAYEIELLAEVQKLSKANEFQKKLLMFLEGTTMVDIPRKPRKTISGPI